MAPDVCSESASSMVEDEWHDASCAGADTRFSCDFALPCALVGVCMRTGSIRRMEKW